METGGSWGTADPSGSSGSSTWMELVMRQAAAAERAASLQQLGSWSGLAWLLAGAAAVLMRPIGERRESPALPPSQPVPLSCRSCIHLQL